MIVPILDAEAAHAADERGGAADGEVHEISFVLARVDDHAGIDSGKHSSLVLRDAQVGFDHGIGVESRVDGVEDRVQTLAGER